MKTTNLQNKFSLIYKIVTVFFYLYITFAIFLIVIFPIIWSAHHINWWDLVSVIFSELQKPQVLAMVISLGFVFLCFFIVNFYILKILKEIAFSMKNGAIFTEENAKNIKILFIVFSAFLVLSWIIFSGWIFTISWVIFCWILYEIFFIWFDYKLKNEKLEEENNLTI